MAALLVVQLAAPARATTPMRTTLRMYDPTGGTATEVTLSDVVRSTVRVFRDSSPGRGVLHLDFTRRGVQRFDILTRFLAHRGTRLRRDQQLAFAVDGVVYWRPLIDHRSFPNGLDGRAGINIGNLLYATAQRLARLIRTG